MFVDASAIVAILNEEPSASEIEKRLAEAVTEFRVSPLVHFEAAVSLARAKSNAIRKDMKPSPEMLVKAQAAVAAFAEALSAEEMVITAEIGRAALDASMLYGKAVGHKADLNFGDCFSYACAKTAGIPIAYVGNDFAQTDMA